MKQLKVQSNYMPPINKLGRKRKNPVEERICKQCHNSFTYKEFLDRNGIFCSKECYFNFSRENASNYRIKAFKLLPNECFYCEDKNKLVVHHLDHDFLNQAW